MNEIWRGVHGHSAYEVSSLGRVRSIPRTVLRSNGSPMKLKGKVLSPKVSNAGYACVNLWREGEYTQQQVHRLVASAFIPNPEGKPHVNHINGNKLSNEATNLEWVTPKGNTAHARAAKLVPWDGTRGYKLTAEDRKAIRVRVAAGETKTDLASEYGVNRRTIYNVVHTYQG